MMKETREPSDPRRPNTPPPVPRMPALHWWAQFTLKLFMIGRMAKLISRFKTMLGDQVYRAQFGVLVAAPPRQKTEGPIHPQARRVTMHNTDWIMGHRITRKKESKKGSIDPALCQHPIQSLSMKGSNQHELCFHCDLCQAAFQRFAIADFHPNPQQPLLGSDRVTWGSMFGETYHTAAQNLHFKQMSLMMAEDKDQKRPWIVRFATYCVQQENMQANFHPASPIGEMLSQQSLVQENPLDWELAPDDSISMASAQPVRSQASIAARTRTRV